jgi:hypothetical protein
LRPWRVVSSPAFLVGIGIIKESPVAKSFALEETTIDQIHAAYRAKTLTCVELVQGYLDRIAAYDQKGPALNACGAERLWRSTRTR